jgi:hypothetical protein
VSHGPFNHDDLAALFRHRDAVPGVDDRAATVAVTRTGTAIEGITTFGPDLLLSRA